MQLILVHETKDFDGWKTAFDQDAEDRAQAGLSVLQVWKGDGIAAALFQVADRPRAQTFLDTQDLLLRNRTGLTHHHHHFVETA
ncbi:MAG: hypothetical protein CSA72_03535 [Rhodobacterales bacterium]|nr:MAG: hypothetical protein CSA72_03535 [Rhodobacterales bacterium]